MRQNPRHVSGVGAAVRGVAVGTIRQRKEGVDAAELLIDKAARMLPATRGRSETFRMRRVGSRRHLRWSARRRHVAP